MKQYQFHFTDTQLFIETLEKIKSWQEQNSQATIMFHIFSEIVSSEILETISDIIKKVLPKALYVGTTSNRNIFNGELSKTEITVMCSIFEKPTTKVEVLQYDFTSETEIEVAKDFIMQVNARPWIKAVEIFMTIPERATSDFCNRISVIPENIQIFGGIACNNDVVSPFSFICSSDKGISEDSIIFVLYGGEEFFVKSLYVTGWQPLGQKLKITKSKNRVLYELDNKPAFEAYHKYLNIPNDDNFYMNTLEFPFLYDCGGTVILRTPISCNSDGSINMAENMETGSMVKLAYGNPNSIMEATETACRQLQEFCPEAIHIFSCAARRAFWESDYKSVQELELFKSLAPSSGFFTFGEYFRNGQKLNQHNITLVSAAMREGEPVEKPQKPIARKHNNDVIQLTTRLATFIGVASAELEEANQKLEYFANHDGLTKLFTRIKFQNIISNNIDMVGVQPFSLIMLDIDNFKRINDIYGHKVGDMVIQSLSDILRCDVKNFVETSSAGRWGGEEFMLVLPSTKLEQALDIGEYIRNKFEKLDFENVLEHTVSIGVVQAKKDETLDGLCGRVDMALYKAKETGKNKVVCI